MAAKKKTKVRKGAGAFADQGERSAVPVSRKRAGADGPRDSMAYVGTYFRNIRARRDFRDDPSPENAQDLARSTKNRGRATAENKKANARSKESSAIRETAYKKAMRKLKRTH